jgi:hypothetical protein
MPAGSAHYKSTLSLPPERCYLDCVSITAKVYDGSVTLPPNLNLPDGTEVEIIIHAAERKTTTPTTVYLPAFNGGGLQAGVNLDDSRATRRLLDQSDTV